MLIIVSDCLFTGLIFLFIKEVYSSECISVKQGPEKNEAIYLILNGQRFMYISQVQTEAEVSYTWLEKIWFASWSTMGWVQAIIFLKTRLQRK